MAEKVGLKQHILRHGIREQMDHVMACYEIDSDFYGERTVSSMCFDFYSLTLITDGKTTIFANYKDYHLHPGDMLLLSPNTLTAMTATSRDFRGITLNCDLFTFQNMVLSQPEFKKYQLLLQHSNAITTHVHANDFEALYQTLLAISRHTLNKSYFQADILKHLTHTVMFDLLRHLPEQLPKIRKRSHTEQTIHRLFDLMLQHYRQEHNIAFYASQLYITPIYLSRIVRQQLHHTVGYYLTGLLYNEACHLLRFTQLPISEIARQLNYNDQSAFGKFFKQKSGISPSAYRMNR